MAPTYIASAVVNAHTKKKKTGRHRPAHPPTVPEETPKQPKKILFGRDHLKPALPHQYKKYTEGGLKSKPTGIAGSLHKTAPYHIYINTYDANLCGTPSRKVPKIHDGDYKNGNIKQPGRWGSGRIRSTIGKTLVQRKELNDMRKA